MLTSYANKVYSQNGEDGIIEFLLSQCENLNYKCFEIGISDGTECNTANLIKNKKYSGVLIDAQNKFNEQFYQGCSFNFMHQCVETDNIQSIFYDNNLVGHYDVFSLDIDGIDYWILKEIIQHKLLTASVIVLEYQDILGPDVSLTIPNIKNFSAWDYDTYEGPNYCGASLKSFIALLQDEYRFVGCEPQGFNGFFMNKNQTASINLEMKDIHPCFDIPKVKFGMEYRQPRTKDMEWTKV